MWDKVHFGKHPMPREVAPPNADLLSLKAMSVHHAITQNPENTFRTAYNRIEQAYQRQANQLRSSGAVIPWVMDIEVEDHRVTCGYYGRQGRTIFGVHKESADAALAIRDAHAPNAAKKPFAERIEGGGPSKGRG